MALFLAKRFRESDLVTFYHLVYEKTGLSERSAMRIIKTVRDLTDEAIDAIDALRIHASNHQLDMIATLPHEEQRSFAKALTGKRSAGKTLEQYKPKVNEDSFQGEVVLALQKRYLDRIYLERRNVGRVIIRDRSGDPKGVFHASKMTGAADYFGIFDGMHFEAEFKAETGAQRESQRKYEARMTQLGVPYFLWKFDPTMSREDNLAARLEQFEARMVTRAAA